jgi:hypothetical protein
VQLLTELLDFSDIYPGIYLINDAKTDVHMCVFEGFMLLNRVVPHVEQELLTLQFVLLDL